AARDWCRAGGAPAAVLLGAFVALAAVDSNRIQTAQTELGVEDGERVKGVFETGVDGGTAKLLDITALLDAAFAKRPAPDRQRRRLEAAGGDESRGASETANEML